MRLARGLIGILILASAVGYGSSLECKQGFNASLGGIPLYHWTKRACSGLSKCFGQELESQFPVLGKVVFRYGACITSSYSDLLDCNKMFGPESTTNPSQFLDLIPDIENRINDVVFNFVYGRIDEVIKLLSNGENIDEFLSGFVTFMEHLGFNMEKFSPLQPSLGKLIIAAFNTTDQVTLNSTLYELFFEIDKLNTDNQNISEQIYTFAKSVNGGSDKELRSNLVSRNFIEKLPGLLRSMIPHQWNASLWYDVMFNILGSINITDTKRSVIDTISIIRSTYQIPNDVSANLDSLLDSLPNLIDQLVKGNATYPGIWYLEMFKIYSQQNNATKALDSAIENFIGGVIRWQIPFELKTTIEWLPGIFYRFFPADKHVIEDVYHTIAKNLDLRNFINSKDVAPPTKLSEFVLDFAKKINSGNPLYSAEQAIVLNFSKLVYDLLSNYTTELDKFFQVLSDGFRTYPNFNGGKIVSNLITATGGSVPKEMKPLLDNLQRVINVTFFETSFNNSKLFSSILMITDAYKITFPDSDFPKLFYNLANAILDIIYPAKTLESYNKRIEKFILDVTFAAIDLNFALFKELNSSNLITKAASLASSNNGFYYSLMSTVDPNDVKHLVKDIVQWLYSLTPGTNANAAMFFNATRSTINTITSKFSKSFTRDLRFLFSPDVCKFGVCDSDLCNTHAYIAQQLRFIKPTTTTSPRTTAVPKSTPKCLGKAVQSSNTMATKYNFPTTEGNTLSRSLETCSNSNYSATIKCIAREGSKDGYFDLSTLKGYRCDVKAESLIASAMTTHVTPANLESITAELSVLSSKQISDDVNEIIEVLNVLQEVTKEQDINVTEEAIVSLIWVTEDIYKAVNTETSEEEKTKLTNDDKVLLLETLEVYASNLVLEDEVFTKTSDTNLFQARRLSCDDNKSIVFSGEISSNNTFHSRAQSTIPKSALPGCSGNTNALFFLHKDSTLFPNPTTDKIKINQVLSSQISKTTLQDLKDPVTQSFVLPPRNSAAKQNFVTQRCAYLDLSTKTWKKDGCKTIINVGSNETSCVCDHMTNFAVLVQTYVVESSYAIDIIGYIGCSCSAVGLIFVLAIYLRFEKLRSNRINQILIHLSACLLMGYLTFLFGVERPRAYAPCMFVGALLQFSFLSAWGWMFAECITMYKKFVKVFGKMSSNYVKKTAAMVYTISFVITLITAILAYATVDAVEYKDWAFDLENDPLFHPSHYVSDRLCWLHGYSLYLGFLMPVAIMFLANIFGFVRIIRVLTVSEAEIRSTKVEKSGMKNHAIRVLTVSMLLGVTWVFAIPLTITDDVTVNEIFGWLFSIGNAFQGIIIFVLFCIKRKDVREMWLNILPCGSQRSSKYSKAVGSVTVSTSDNTGAMQRTNVTTLGNDDIIEDTQQSSIV